MSVVAVAANKALHGETLYLGVAVSFVSKGSGVIGNQHGNAL
jgi:hypothetical protein